VNKLGRTRQTDTTKSALVRYRRSAVDRGLAWGLADDLFESLIGSPCFYCGVPPSESKNGHNGIDRIDSKAGYDPDNVVACCTRCNAMKMGLTREAFIEHAIRIARHLGGVKGKSPVDLYKRDEEKKRRIAEEDTDRTLRVLYAGLGMKYPESDKEFVKQMTRRRKSMKQLGV
jgi:hypothetical protein